MGSTSLDSYKLLVKNLYNEALSMTRSDRPEVPVTEPH
jgi:hypothetical protein